MNDIEILKEFIKYYETEYFKGKKLNSSIKIIVDEDDVEAIENLIQRNKDLEQIEKEHKEENGRLREENKILRHGLEENTEEIDELNVIIDLMAEQLTTPVHSKKWVIDYFTNKVEEDIKE